MASMDKETTEILEGVAIGKIVQALTRKYGDLLAARLYFYTPAQYVKDLLAAGYTKQSVDTAKTEGEIGDIIMQSSGYTFAGGPGNLRGSSRLTADPYTYQAAVGQKVPAYLLLSAMGTGTLGLIGTGLRATGKHVLNSKYDNIISAASISLLTDGLVRAVGLDGSITAPSGFDVTTQPTMQNLDRSAVQNLQRLSSENQRLQQEITQLRSAQYPRGMPPGVPSYTVNAQQPIVQVTEIIPSKGAQPIKDRTHMVGGPIQKATPEAIRKQTGLVTLAGGK